MKFLFAISFLIVLNSPLMGADLNCEFPSGLKTKIHSFESMTISLLDSEKQEWRDLNADVFLLYHKKDGFYYFRDHLHTPSLFELNNESGIFSWNNDSVDPKAWLKGSFVRFGKLKKTLTWSNKPGSPISVQGLPDHPEILVTAALSCQYVE